MAEEYKTFLHRWFEEVWNKGREEAIDEMFAEEGIANGLVDENGNTVRGPKDFKNFFHKFRSAFPDLKITIEETVCEGDKMAALCRVKGTHEGHGIGIGPTNQPIEFSGICIVRLKDGKIVEAWNHFDFMSLYQQLGALQLILNE